MQMIPKVIKYAPYTYTAKVELSDREIFHVFVIIPIEKGKTIVPFSKYNADGIQTYENSKEILLKVINEENNNGFLASPEIFGQVIPQEGQLFWANHFSFDFPNNYAVLDPHNYEFTVEVYNKVTSELVESRNSTTVLYTDADSYQYQLEELADDILAIGCPYLYLAQQVENNTDKLLPKLLIPTTDLIYYDDAELMYQAFSTMSIFEGIVPLLSEEVLQPTVTDDTNSSATIKIIIPENINSTSFLDFGEGEGFSSVNTLFLAQRDDLAFYQEIQRGSSNKNIFDLAGESRNDLHNYNQISQSRNSNSGRRRRKMKVRVKSATPINNYVFSDLV